MNERIVQMWNAGLTITEIAGRLRMDRDDVAKVISVATDGQI